MSSIESYCPGVTLAYVCIVSYDVSPAHIRHTNAKLAYPYDDITRIRQLEGDFQQNVLIVRTGSSQLLTLYRVHVTVWV